MVSTFDKFRVLIDESIDIIDESINDFEISSNGHQLVSYPFEDAPSLLQKCEQVFERYTAGNNRRIAVIHHFACSGGTLFSKCLSAMPNTYLLSEVHPMSSLHPGNGKPKYLPSDIVSLASYAGISDLPSISQDIFLESIKIVHDHVTGLGAKLVLRDHSHSDYCVGEEVRNTKSVVDSLSNFFDIDSVITLRNPIDSYLSLRKNGWVHFEPETFDEYCRRLVLFLNEYEGVPVFLYEDFVENPELEMEKICSYLDLSYDELFIDLFHVFEVTGDSGRKGNLISPRSREVLSEEFVEEIMESQFFREVVSLYPSYSFDSVN